MIPLVKDFRKIIYNPNSYYYIREERKKLKKIEKRQKRVDKTLKTWYIKVRSRKYHKTDATEKKGK